MPGELGVAEIAVGGAVLSVAIDVETAGAEHVSHMAWHPVDPAAALDAEANHAIATRFGAHAYRGPATAIGGKDLDHTAR